PNRVIDGFSVGADMTSVYCLWSTTLVGNAPLGAPPSAVDGLVFPVSNNAATIPITVTSTEALSLRWPQIAPGSVPGSGTGLGPGLFASVTASSWDGQSWHDLPAVINLSPDGKAAIQPVT